MVNRRLHKNGPWVRLLLTATVAVVISAATLVWTRTQITSLRYQLSGLLNLESELRNEVEKLRIESAALSTPERIERRGRSLGLRYPQPGQLVAVPSGDVTAGLPK